jgi:hypothetical protein
MTAKEMMEESRDTMTIRQAIDLLNERQCHPLGLHLALVREDMLEKTDMFGGDWLKDWLKNFMWGYDIDPADLLMEEKDADSHD